MKLFRFEAYYAGRGAECLSGIEHFHSAGKTLIEAKHRLARRLGCHKTYFDDQTEIKQLPFRKTTETCVGSLGIRIQRYEGVNNITAVEVLPYWDDQKADKKFEFIKALIENHDAAGISIDHEYLKALRWAVEDNS